jgi:hypothetical protein
VEYVISHLREANFDPEFYRRHEKEMGHAFALHREQEHAAGAVLR